MNKTLIKRSDLQINFSDYYFVYYIALQLVVLMIKLKAQILSDKSYTGSINTIFKCINNLIK